MSVLEFCVTDNILSVLWITLLLCMQSIQGAFSPHTELHADPSLTEAPLLPTLTPISGNTIDSCSVQLANGVVNLWPIGMKNSPPRWSNLPSKNPSQDPGSYYFDPCYPFDEGKCENSLVCRNVGKTQTSIGLAEESEFGVDQYNQLTISYKAPLQEIGKPEIVTMVTLKCQQNSIDDKLEIGGNETANIFTMILTSRCCCPGVCPLNAGLSFGSILCILFVCVVFVYLVGGVIYKKFVKGASGIELIPHIEFWCDLPNLIVDGVNFVFTCARKTESTPEGPGTGAKSNYESI